MKPADVCALIGILLLLGFTGLTVTNQREGNAAIVREVLLMLAVLAMWLSLRLA